MAGDFDVTRRGLLRGLGTTAIVGTACKTQVQDTDPEIARTPLAGGERLRLRFRLDGAEVDVQAETRATLLDLLRLDLDATGTKRSCDRGACGACMVLVDGRAMNACMMLAVDVDGRSVETVAGLATGDELSPLQTAFVARDATQCGFCTSGMLISCTALLRGGGKVDATRVKAAIAGNYCRCGTYPHVVQAVLDVAGSAGESQPS